MKKLISAIARILVIALLTQLIPLQIMAEALVTEDFKPGIDVMGNVVNETLTEQEIQKLADEFKVKTENDLKIQNDQIIKYQEVESNNKKNNKKYEIEVENDRIATSKANLTPNKTTKSSTSSMLFSPLKSTSTISTGATASTSSIATMSTAPSIATMSTTSSELINAPKEIDAEFNKYISGILQGDTVTVTWAPVEGATGYNIYKDDVLDNTTLVTTENYEVDEISTEHKIIVKTVKDSVESSSGSVLIVGQNITVSSNKTLEDNCVYKDLYLTGGTLDLNGKTLKIYGNLNQSKDATPLANSEMNINAGKLVVVKGQYLLGLGSILRMNKPADYVYVGGEFNFGTNEIHDGTILSDGLIQVTGPQFKLTSTISGKFMPGLNHRVYLNSLSGITTVDFNNDTVSKFNILGINKPRNMYTFLPANRAVDSFYTQLIQLENAERYFGVSGVYPPSGNFSRSYTDMAIPAKGFDIKVSRTYNSSNKKTSGIFGAGWTFEYEAGIDFDTAGNTATVNLPGGNVVRFTDSNGTYTAVDSRADLVFSNSKYLLTMKDKTKYSYKSVNSKYVLDYIEDYIGNKITVNYLNNKIDTIVDSFSKGIKVTYVSATSIEISDIATTGRKITYTLENSKLKSVKDPLNNEIYSYGYDSVKGLLNLVKKANITFESLTYDPDLSIDRVITLTDMYSKVSTYEYDPGKTIVTSTVNNESRKSIQKYDENYAISETVGDDGKSNVTKYVVTNVNGAMVNKYNEVEYEVDIYGNKTIYGRDSRGNVTSITNPDKSIKEYGYYTDDVKKDLLQWEKSEVGNYTYYEYNSTRQLIRKYVYKMTVSQPYPELNLLNSTNSYITTYKYIDSGLNIGLLESVTEPKYYTTPTPTIFIKKYEYNSDGLVLKITDPEGGVIEYQYNSLRLPTVEKILLNGASKYITTFNEYDLNGRIERKTICNGEVLVTPTGTQSTPTPILASSKSIERYLYDACGRLVQKISPKQYNVANDNIASHTYSDTTVGYRYQYLGASDKVTKETNPENFVTDYQYAEDGNLLYKTDPDLNVNGGSNRAKYKYIYDSRSRLKNVSFSTDNGSNFTELESYIYKDPEIVLSSNTDNYLSVVEKHSAITECNKYDYAGRLVSNTKSPGTDEVTMSTQYNTDGTVASTKDGEGYYSYYFYDTLKRPVHIWTPYEGESGVTSSYIYKRFVYDENGNKLNEAVRKTKVVASGFINNKTAYHNLELDYNFFIATNTYYKNNKLCTSVGISGDKTAYYYDSAGIVNKVEKYKDTTNKITISYKNNYLGKPVEELQYTKNRDIYPNSLTDDGTYTLHKNFLYDLNGNILMVNEPIYQRSELYAYDNLNRLIGKLVSTSMYNESSSSVLNWQGNPLSETNGKGYITLYTYDLRGFLRKTVKNVTVLSNLITPTSAVTNDSNAYQLTSSINMMWNDNYGRRIAEVEPNNYIANMDSLYDISGLSYAVFKNYTYYNYDSKGRINEKGFFGQKKSYAGSSNWRDMLINKYEEYNYDKNNNQIKLTDEDDYYTETKYTPQGKVLSSLDYENKLRYLPYSVKYEYDVLGRVTKEKHAKSDTSAEVPVNGVIPEANMLGNTTTYTYTSEVLTDGINSNTVTKTVSYSENGGVIEKKKFDLLGNLIEQTNCFGGTEYTTKYQYNDLNKVSVIQQPCDNSGTLKEIRHQYDALGNLVYRRDLMNTLSDTTDDVCELFTYNVVSLRNENYCKQKYDGSEVIITTTKYDKNGNIDYQIDGNNITTTFTNDEMDRRTSSSITVGGVVQKAIYDYDLTGNQIRTKDWRGNSYINNYDQQNRLYQKTDPQNVAFEKLEYNNRDLQITSRNAYDKITSYTYDGNSRLLSTSDPVANHITSQKYDNFGNVSEKTDGKSNKTTYKYDVLGRLIEVNNPLSQKTSYAYYIDGNVKTQTLGTTYSKTYNYNALNKVSKITYPDTKFETFLYDPLGNLKQKTDRKSLVTTYEYDCHDRFTKQTTVEGARTITVSVPNTPTEKGYDGNGNLKKISIENKVSGTVNSTVTTERTYDALDRVLTKKETTVEGITPTITTTVIGPINYTYDITADADVETGELKERSVYPGFTTGQTITVDKIYDKAGRLRAVTEDGQKTDYLYYNDGRRQSVTYNDNFKQTYTYYDDGLLNDLKNEAKNSLGAYAETEYYKYYYDNAHNISQKDERKNGTTKTVTYGYDVLNRLNKVTEPGKVTDYTFDTRGNRDTELVTQGTTVTYKKYDYNSGNQLTYETKRNSGSTGTITQKLQYTYDNNGNMTKVTDITGTATDITTNTYTPLNQLETSTSSGTTMTNLFNAEGNRVEKTSLTGTITGKIRYFYEGDRAVFEYSGSLATVFNVVGSNLIARKTGSNKVYYFYNGHGDVTALLDASTRFIRSKYDYDAFGNLTNEQYYDSNGVAETVAANMIKSSVRYGEYQYDAETEVRNGTTLTRTGYYNLNARYYDASSARFLQEDTYQGDVNFPQSLNLYAYCNNEPLMYSDPTGHLSATINGQNIGNVSIQENGVYGNLTDIAAAVSPENSVVWEPGTLEGIKGRAIYSFWSNLDNTDNGGVNYTLTLAFGPYYNKAMSTYLENENGRVFSGEVARLLGDASFFINGDGKLQAKISTMSFIAGRGNKFEINYDDTKPVQGSSAPADPEPSYGINSTYEKAKKPLFTNKEISRMVLGPAGDVLYNVANDGKIAFTDWDLEGNMILSGQERLDARYNTTTNIIGAATFVAETKAAQEEAKTLISQLKEILKRLKLKKGTGNLNPDYIKGPVGGAPEPEVQEFIKKFEERYPGRSYDSGHQRMHSDGKYREIDFETDNVIIEFKSNNGKGLADQLAKRLDTYLNPNGKVVIGVSKKRMHSKIASDIEAVGGLAERHFDLDSLIDLIKP